MVRLISMAMTGYYRTMQRPRAHRPLSMLKYDPIGATTSIFQLSYTIVALYRLLLTTLSLASRSRLAFLP